MKLSSPFPLVLAITAFCMSLFAEEPKLSDAEKAAKAQTDAYVAAFNKADTATLGAMYAEDVQYTSDEGTLYSGREAVVEGLSKYFAKNKGAKLELTIETARFLTPEVLLEKGYATLNAPDADTEVTRYSATYLKKGDSWLIAELDETTLPPADEAAQALGELEWLVGTWKDNTPGITVETRVSWTKNQRFMRRSFTITHDGEDPVEGTEVIGYDAAKGRIRSWVFDSEGGIGENVWRREGNKWLILSVATGTDGSQTTAENILTMADGKKFTWESVNRANGGEALPNIDKIEVTRVGDE